jgi:hypothetical protein
MKEASLTEIFCEVLGGLGLAVVIVPLLALANNSRIEDIFHALLSKLDLAVLGSVLLLAYLAGAIVDAVGFAIEELFLGKLVTTDKLSDTEVAAFWKGVNEHVLRYRDQQWTWYSCYRNLFILFFPSAILWTWVVVLNYSWCRGIFVFSIFVVVEISLLVTMKSLVKIYYKITRSV